MTGERPRSMDGPVASAWKDLLADAEAIAEEYRDRGWEVLTVEPGDVAPVTKEERFGFSVLLPDSEYDAVEDLVDRDAAGFGEAEVYRRSVGNTVFALAVELDETTETAVVVPLYYVPAETEAVLETAAEEGELLVHLRPLSIENWVTFSHDDPSLFVPGDDAIDVANSSDAEDATDEGDANDAEDAIGEDFDDGGIESGDEAVEPRDDPEA